MEPHAAVDLPVSPAWAQALGWCGKGLVWLGVLLFVLSFVGMALDRKNVGKWPVAAFIGGCISIFLTFATLAFLFVRDRFEFVYVYQRSDALNPLKYKIASIWSGQEGSFLLWATAAAIFGLFALKGLGPYRRWFIFAYAVFLASLCGILAYETPFAFQPLLDGKLYVPPVGAGMTPSLQNYWIVIHPPTIFLGFGSLTVLFAYAVSALISRNFVDWAQRLRPWAIVSTAITGIGLCMGGFWAYETLGWGGFWMWDPVENVSFVPWIMAIVLVHGLIVQATKGKWIATNAILAGLPFLAFVYGTFLTRAGFLDGASVHSFAQMNPVAHKVLLAFFGLASVGFVWLWFSRLKSLRTQAAAPEKGVSREKAYTAGIVLLTCLATATAIGMSVPLFQALGGQKPKVVPEHVYHTYLSWFFIPIMVLVALGPFISWRHMTWREFGNRVSWVLSVSMGLLGLIMFVLKSPTIGVGADPKEKISFMSGEVAAMPWIAFLLGICLLAMVGNIWRMAELKRGSKLGWGPFVAHFGVAMLMAGMVLSRGFERKAELFVQDGVPARGLGYTITYKTHTGGFTDRNNKMLFEVQSETDKFEARPGLYYTVGSQGEVNPMVWPHIQRFASHDIYFTLHPQVLEASNTITIKPGETRAVTVDDFAIGKQIKIPVTYVKPTREGTPGTTGAKFGAQLKFATPQGTVTSSPTMELTESGMRRNPDIVSDDYYVNIVRMNAADQAIDVQLGFIRPIYPVELFYKPMTIFVWLGAGIMTLGGFMSALMRRYRPKGTKVGTSVAEIESDTIESKDAPLATA